MLRPYSLPLVASLAMVVLLLAACGGSSDESADTTLAPTTTEQATTTTTAPTTTIAPTTTSSTAPTTTTTLAPTTVAESQAAMVAEKDVVYVTWEEGPLTLDMYAPVEAAGAPVVVYLPGGGQTQAPMAMVEGLVDNGVIVFVAPFEPGNSGIAKVQANPALFRSQVDSVGCAIHSARVRASEIGSDDPAVVLVGFSNGAGPAAHAALFGATLESQWDEYETTGGPARQVNCEVTEGSTHVDALVGFAGTYDTYVPIYGLGSVYQQEHDPELWEFLTNPIGENPDLTIRLIHGESDRIVNYEVSTLFAAALNDAGYSAGKVVGFSGEHVVPADLAVEIITEAIKP